MCGLPLGSQDPDILLRAEREERILVTLDRSTMAGKLRVHLASGRHSPGILSIRHNQPMVDVVEFLVLAAYASDASEWRDRIGYVP